ncbi:MAG TPA: glycosyltransferase family 39 protein [Bryobacteraceae bacterium]|nr:glycosyltransferase family 39 protein [Bryobacteraceae bacterium]
MLAFALRLPFLNQAIQGDDLYYLYGAQHAQIDPLHPHNARFYFLGDRVDMRGNSHPPLNAWLLGALLAICGDVGEVPFHLAYALFSIAAALAMYSIARRFCERPVQATLLFLAVPAFVVNGNSLESDLPFLAFWMVAVAAFLSAVDSDSRAILALSGVAGFLAGLAAYQAILLAPILAVVLWAKRRDWAIGWTAVLAAPIAIGAWQLFERATTGQFPALMLADYMKSYSFQAPWQKLRSAAALVVHLGWVVSPLIVMKMTRGSKLPWIAALAAATGAALYDPHPLFWVSIGCGVLVLIAAARARGFIGAWLLIFAAGAGLVFFAGSARYLLPLAAPVAILAVRACSTKFVMIGFVLQIGLSLGFAIVNYQHWAGYRDFAASLAPQVKQHRTWIDAEWGLRFYLESEGALPLARNQTPRPREIVVSSELFRPVEFNAAIAPLASLEIRPSIPLRLISIDGKSAYSVVGRGIWPFEFSSAPIDRVRAELVIERKATLSYITPGDPAAREQIVSGLYPDGWMSERATVLLKPLDPRTPLRAEFEIEKQSTARRVQLLVEGTLVAEETFPGPGAYQIVVPWTGGNQPVTVTLVVDKTFTAPPDERKLGIMVRAIGFRGVVPL